MCIFDFRLIKDIFVQKMEKHLRMPLYLIPTSKSCPSSPQKFPKSADFLKRRDPAVPSFPATSSTWPPCSVSPSTTGAARATPIASKTSPLAWSTAVHEKVSINLFTAANWVILKGCWLASLHAWTAVWQIPDVIWFPKAEKEGTNKPLRSVIRWCCWEWTSYIQHVWKECFVMP